MRRFWAETEEYQGVGTTTAKRLSTLRRCAFGVLPRDTVAEDRRKTRYTVQRRSLNDVQDELRDLTERIRAASRELEDTLPRRRRTDLAYDHSPPAKKRGK